MKIDVSLERRAPVIGVIDGSGNSDKLVVEPFLPFAFADGVLDIPDLLIDFFQLCRHVREDFARFGYRCVANFHQLLQL